MAIVKITASPFDSNLESVEGIVMALHVPFDDKGVTVKIDPNITEYNEQPHSSEGVQVRQLTESQDTKETKTLKFDFQNNNEQKIQIADGTYLIKLLNIGNEMRDSQSFLNYEFHIEKLEEQFEA